MRKNNKGFTLIEMLIVVAIIAILVAVSIPLVNNSLERTREATDAANERAAKAEAIIMYLNDNWTPGDEKAYNAEKGSFDGGAGTRCGKCANHKNATIMVKVDANGDVTVRWDNNNTPHNGSVDDTH